MTKTNIETIIALLHDAFPGCDVMPKRPRELWNFQIIRGYEHVAWLRVAHEFMDKNDLRKTPGVARKAVAELQTAGHPVTVLIAGTGEIHIVPR